MDATPSDGVDRVEIPAAGKCTFSALVRGLMIARSKLDWARHEFGEPGKYALIESFCKDLVGAIPIYT